MLSFYHLYNKFICVANLWWIDIKSNRKVRYYTSRAELFQLLAEIFFFKPNYENETFL